MIDRTHALPVVRQCQLLALSRSTAYYQPTPVSAADLALMLRLDELHLDHPFAGAQMLRDLLRREGHSIGRRHVSTLMTRMGIEAVYRKPHTSRRHPAHRSIPIFCANWRSHARITSGRRTSPTSRCSAASCICSRS
jgi:putative transposase